MVAESSLVVLLEFCVGGDSCISYRAKKSQRCTCHFNQLIKQAINYGRDRAVISKFVNSPFYFWLAEMRLKQYYFKTHSTSGEVYLNSEIVFFYFSPCLGFLFWFGFSCCIFLAFLAAEF